MKVMGEGMGGECSSASPEGFMEGVKHGQVRHDHFSLASKATRLIYFNKNSTF